MKEQRYVITDGKRNYYQGLINDEPSFSVRNGSLKFSLKKAEEKANQLQKQGFPCYVVIDVDSSNRLTRLNLINEFIQFIVETDKERHNPTLGSKNDDGTLRYGQFLFAENGLLYYKDSYTQQKMRPINHFKWDGFSEGGTMRQLVLVFGQFIMKGTQGFLNDYKEIWAWSYENTMKLRRKALEVGFIEHMDYPYAVHERNDRGEEI